jgi:hypothetical protein
MSCRRYGYVEHQLVSEITPDLDGMLNDLAALERELGPSSFANFRKALETELQLLSAAFDLHRELFDCFHALDRYMSRDAGVEPLSEASLALASSWKKTVADVRQSATVEALKKAVLDGKAEAMKYAEEVNRKVDEMQHQVELLRLERDKALAERDAIREEVARLKARRRAEGKARR